MIDLEKINRPIIYDKSYMRGYTETPSRVGNTKYLFYRPILGESIVHCFSLLDDNKTDVIAGFRVTKIHDTRRENS